MTDHGVVKRERKVKQIAKDTTTTTKNSNKIKLAKHTQNRIRCNTNNEEERTSTFLFSTELSVRILISHHSPEMGGAGGGGASSTLKKLLKKLILIPCASFSSSSSASSSSFIDSSPAPATATATASDWMLKMQMQVPAKKGKTLSEITEEGEPSASFSSKNTCAICLEPLVSNNGAASPGQAIFTSQCSHAFHLACISSNIRHGNVTCPICRAQWTRFPQTLYPPCWLSRKQDDPVLRILDDSISTFRVHRRSFLRSARYDDDDPVEPDAHSLCQPRLYFSASHSTAAEAHPSSTQCSCTRYSEPQPHSISMHGTQHRSHSSKIPVYLSVRLAPQQATDLVLVASPNGPHLRLLKQCLALVVFSLRPIDRLAIVSYSSAAARIFPLRRMTAYGKRAALLVIDRLFYTGYADQMEGIKKGIKILKDRTYKNPRSSILHLSDNPTSSRSYHGISDAEIELPIPVHRFHVASTMSIMNELEEFLVQLLGGGIRETQLRIGDEEETRVIGLGDLVGGEERKILLEIGAHSPHLEIAYSYVDSGIGSDEQIKTGEVLVRVDDRRDIGDDLEGSGGFVGRTSCAESRDFHDPCMARRWAKRLHGR
ncbi:putative E3 ubiquitin-protein ligase WAVH2 [Drosera capensis]